MSPRPKVSSRHVSTRLKELQTPQDSEWCWVREPFLGLPIVKKWDRRRRHYISAFTGEQLYDMMPDYLPGLKHYELEWEESGNEWRVYYTDGITIYEEMIISANT